VSVVEGVVVDVVVDVVVVGAIGLYSLSPEILSNKQDWISFE